MVSLFHDAPVPHHQDTVGITEGGKPVRDNKAGTPLHHVLEGLLDLDLRPGVDGGSCLIKDQHWREAEHGPRNAEQLLFSL